MLDRLRCVLPSDNLVDTNNRAREKIMSLWMLASMNELMNEDIIKELDIVNLFFFFDEAPSIKKRRQKHTAFRTETASCRVVCLEKDVLGYESKRTITS